MEIFTSLLSHHGARNNKITLLATQDGKVFCFSLDDSDKNENKEDFLVQISQNKISSQICLIAVTQLAESNDSCCSASLT